MITKPLNKTTNYFITSKGYVFKVENGREVPVKIDIHHKSKEIYALVNKKYLNLLNLMVEHFMPEVKAFQTISFKANPQNRIPLHTIKVKNVLNEWIPDEDDRMLINFNCSQKASSANMRCEKKITALQVFLSLKLNNFKCIYCGSQLKEKDWHLEHYIPLSKGGKNVFENILPSCSVCNFMKGSLQGGQFYKQCARIFKNFLFKSESNTATTA